MVERVAVVGAGLAGLAAAAALAERDFAVTIYESRGRAGGRASSFHDTASGQLVDTCQHVSMGCCTNLAHFCRTVGIAHHLRPQPTLYFMTPDRRISRFEADRLPAPLHLLRSFARLHYLSLADKGRIAWGLGCLRLTSAARDPPFLPWLRRHGQNQRTIDRFWRVVLVSALNEEPERIGLRYARKVFVEGFLRHRRGFEVEVPAVPLGRLYGEELQAWLGRHGVRLLLNTGVRCLLVEAGEGRTPPPGPLPEAERGVAEFFLPLSASGRGPGGGVLQSVGGLVLRDGGTVTADWYVSAVPFDRLLDLLPEEIAQQEPYFAGLRNLETSPITSVHVWYDRPVMDLPHVVLVDGVGQWVFNRGEVAPGEHYLQVVVSAARAFRGLSHAEIQVRVTGELARLFPAAAPEAMRRARVVTEHAATFSAVPGVDQWRPSQTSPLPNLFMAGDWTATGWPATMEGAVRSGYLAAEALLRRLGRVETLVQPDLG